MNLRYAVVVGCLFVMTSGCAYLPEGYLPEVFASRAKPESPERLFVDDIDADEVPVAAPRVATAPEKPGLKIRKSKRGNMESYVVRGQRYFTLPNSDEYSARGVASWYGPNFHGRTASNGEVYDMYRLTAAHKTLPLPTYARVTHAQNGRSVVVKINDRGPFSGDRIIDLSFAAALRLGMINDGTAEVEIQALSPEEMMVLSGPENKLGIDFYRTDEVAEGQPEGEAETVNVAAVDIDQKPLTALPGTTQPVATGTLQNSEPLLDEIPQAGASEPASQAAASAVASAQGTPLQAGSGRVNSLQASSQQASSQAISVEAGSGQASAAQAEAGSQDNNLQDAVLPVVADVNVQGIVTVPAALQTVAGQKVVAQKTAARDRDGYYIQAGVYARVADAERVAADVVLASDGEEEVNVKPLEGSSMYRITVGPIVTPEHAAKVSGLLTESGLENFTVHVK